MFAWSQQRLRATAIGLLPFLLTLALILLATLPWRLPHAAALCPALALMSVFYWTLMRPDLMPAGAAFLLGFGFDLVSGQPLGLGALTLTLAQAVTVSQRRALADKSLAVISLAFTMVAIAAALLQWIAVSILFASPVPAWPVLGQLAVTIVLFPALAAGFGRIRRRWVPDPEGAR